MAAEKAAPSAQFIKNSDIPVPTLLAGYSEQDESVAYWKSVNDAVSTSEEGVYRQSLNSDAWRLLTPTTLPNAGAHSTGSLRSR